MANLATNRIKVVLTQKQYNEAVKLAQGRNRKEARFGSGSYVKTTSSFDTHLIGVVPEIAVALYCNTQMNTEIYDSHGDDGTDINLPKLGKCQIKTTTYQKDPFLRVEINKFKEDVDSYILCYYNPKKNKRTVWIIGWASRSEVLKGKQRKFLRYGPKNYVLTEEQLHQCQF